MSAAILIWAFGLASPVAVFPVLYLFTIFYYTWRTIAHRSTLRKAPSLDPQQDGTKAYVAIPTISLSHWNIVKRAKRWKLYDW